MRIKKRSHLKRYLLKQSVKQISFEMASFFLLYDFMIYALEIMPSLTVETTSSAARPRRSQMRSGSLPRMYSPR